MTPDMKSLMYILENLYRDLIAPVCSSADPERDICYVRARLEKEGLSYLTITLPSFAKDLEQALEHRQVLPSHFRSFRKRGLIPAFLSGTMRSIFDKSTGRLLDSPDKLAIHAVRQVCLFAKKLALPCTPNRVAKSFSDYIEIDQQIQDDWKEHSFASSVQRVADFIWPLVLRQAEERVETFSLLPKHGPGATAERISGNRKYVWARWHERLEPWFPFTEYGIANLHEVHQELHDVHFVLPEDEAPVRVISVPKTLKAPRIIAIEPVCMQFCQQALMHAIVEAMEGHILTRGVFNFHDQSVNQRAALGSSVAKDRATLDLSEASDRVSYELVKSILLSTPSIWGPLDACRSRTASVPINGSDTEIRLKKFASMGSGVCFPIEALVFYTIILSCILTVRNLPVTWDTIKVISREINVFGDDLIVPTTEALAVIEWLEAFGLKVNRTKSFVEGNFRESCGVDAYDGVLVTPVYVRSLRPTNRRDGSEILSWVATANQFYLAGMWSTASYFRRMVERIHPIPYGNLESQGCRWYSYLYRVEGTRWHQGLSAFEVRTLVARATKRPDNLGGRSALYKCLSALHRRSNVLEKSSADLSHLEISQVEPEHLVHSVRRGVVTINSRWVMA